MKIAIAHDYLLQHGGAERVVATWARSLPLSVIHSLAFSPDQTFEVFGARRVHTRIRPSVVTSRIEYLLPALPILARQVHVRDADVALVSTSGWAHQFDFGMPTLAYVHSPARWLYASDDYSKKLGAAGKIGLAMSRRFLGAMDVPAMKKMTALASNSKVTQRRILGAYGIDTPIIHPPVEAIDAEPTAPMRVLPCDFSIVVSRNRGYKNVDLAISASSLAGLPCVVVGAGTEAFDNPPSGTYGLGRVTDAELKWLYEHARVLIGSASEDFGLTVLEANLEGTPVAAIPTGGYLETVQTDRNGALAESAAPGDLCEAIRHTSSVDPEACRRWAGEFSPARHMDQLNHVLRSL